MVVGDDRVDGVMMMNLIIDLVVMIALIMVIKW